MQSVTDFEVLHTLDLSYKVHCNNLIARTNRLSSYILRSFVYRNPKFLFRLFVAYIRFLLGNASPIWSPNYSVELNNRLKGLQRMYTKRIPSIAHLLYNNRLTYIGLQRLEARRLCSDLLFLSKLKFILTHLTLADFLSILLVYALTDFLFTHLLLTLIFLLKVIK